MSKQYTPRVGDTVTIPGNDAIWLVLAPAPPDTGIPCECKAPRWHRMKWRGNVQYESHSATCPARRKACYYWLQDTATGHFYRPSGTDTPVHKSELALVTAYSLPTRRELAAALF